MDSLLDSIKEVFNEVAVCRVIKVDNNPRYSTIKKAFEKQWKTQEGRLSLYNAFQQEKHTWEIFTHWLANEELVEQDVIVRMWDRYINIRIPPQEVTINDIQLDFLGDDWW